MKKDDLVSIIIPCYNQAQYLEEAVESVANQTYSNIEIIIVNDGSSDNTERVAIELQKRHPEKIHLLTQENNGLSDARNRGIKEAQGNYILPLDADDKIDTKMISECMDLLKKNNVDIVYTDVQCFGLNQDIHLKSTQHMLYDNPPSPSSLFRYQVWETTGGFKKNMSGGYEDWEYWVNVFSHGFTFHYYHKALFYYRIKKESMYVSVKQKSDYLAAKVVANNQEMYTHAKVEKAIATIKNYEVLSDFYFYSDKIIQDDEMFLGRIGEMLKSDFHPHQVIEISNQRIGVFTLDTQETIEDINSLYEYMNIDILFLYAPLRYEIKGLHACQFSWKNNIGLVKAEGSIFPFDLRTKKEKPVLQTTACKRLQDYTDYLQDDLEKRREWLKHLNKMLDKDEQFKLLEEKDAIIKERGNLYDVLKQKDEELKRRQRLITEKDAIIYEMTNRWKYLDGIVTLLQKLWRKIT